MWLIDYLWCYVPLKNISLNIWRRHHCRWRAAKFRPMLGTQGLWAGRDLYRATPAVTRDLSFSGLIRRTAPFSRLLRHTRGCGGSILTRILTGNLSIIKVLNKILSSKLKDFNTYPVCECANITCWFWKHYERNPRMYDKERLMTWQVTIYMWIKMLIHLQYFTVLLSSSVNIYFPITLQFPVIDTLSPMPCKADKYFTCTLQIPLNQYTFYEHLVQFPNIAPNVIWRRKCNGPDQHQTQDDHPDLKSGGPLQTWPSAIVLEWPLQNLKGAWPQIQWKFSILYNA
jgi:hypothetical protein